MFFKEWLVHKENINENTNSKMEIINMYFHQNKSIKEIANQTGSSIGSIYRTIKETGSPNRTKKNHHSVHALSDSGFNFKTISDLSGYSLRHIRNILKK